MFDWLYANKKMADLILKSSDGAVMVDINAGLTGVHKITVSVFGAAGQQISRVVSEQELIDLVAPCVKQLLAPSVSSAPPPGAPDSIGG